MSSLTTIAALATAPYPAGLAVIRISGPQTKQALRALFQAREHPVQDPRRMCLGKLIDHSTQKVIDTALAVFMPGPRSFTGEDVGELQFHGSPLLVERVLQSLYAFGIAPAEPGEFSRRAFTNGKMDLTQAEAIADLINAGSAAGLRLASEQLEGKLSGLIEQIAEPLRNDLAELEAQLDFPDEGIEPATIARIQSSIADTRAVIHDSLGTFSYGHVVRRGFRVLLCGRPNVGKSSLMNALLKVKRAIVTPVPGTTRDTIEETLELEGFRFVLCDSAGLRDTNDEVERLGIELAYERLGWADLVLLVGDAGDTERSWLGLIPKLAQENKLVWLVINKIDLHSDVVGTIDVDPKLCPAQFYVSAQTGGGVDALRDALVGVVRGRLTDAADESFVVTNERHRDCLARAEAALVRCTEATASPEIISLSVREALNAPEESVGKTYNEDILGRIFSKFCIGK